MSFKNFISTSTFPSSNDNPANAATPLQVDEVINKVKTAYKYADSDINSIRANICALLQNGATSPKFDQNKSYDLLGDSKLVEVKVLKKACTDVASNLTLRKLARGLREDIVVVAQKTDMPGNLSKRFLVDCPDATIDELVWVSDFQTFNNQAPDRVKSWLMSNFQNRFGKNP